MGIKSFASKLLKVRYITLGVVGSILQVTCFARETPP